METMNNWQRAGVALLLVAMVLVSGWWLWGRLLGSMRPPPPTAPPATVALTVPVPPVTPLRAPRGYRLAGVAVGEPESFAVVEAPNGVNALYRLNAEIPGLGRLLRIEAERIIVLSAAGPLELWLMPAPTPTRTRTPAARAATAVRRTPLPPAALPPAAVATFTAKPRPAAAAASTPGSTPSAAPGSPAS
jgi:hypothetical protein